MGVCVNLYRLQNPDRTETLQNAVQNTDSCAFSLTQMLAELQHYQCIRSKMLNF